MTNITLDLTQKLFITLKPKPEYHELNPQRQWFYGAKWIKDIFKGQEYSFNPEFFLSGGIHWHGIVKVKNSRTYFSNMWRMRQYGFVDVKSIKDTTIDYERALKYQKKTETLMVETLGISDVVITNSRRIKHINHMFNATQPQLISDEEKFRLWCNR